jgi:transcriptional regulator with XRE-family HTH domain
MIKEAEVTASYPVQNAVPGRTIDVHHPTFSYTRSGEVTGFIPQTRGRISPNLGRISPNLLPYLFLSATTGSELNDVDLVVVVEKISEGVTTSDQITFEFKSWVRKRSIPKSVEQLLPSVINLASAQAKRLRKISSLKIERLAEIFGVSRTTYYKWIAGSTLHDEHREQLLEVLPLVEEALQRLGGPNATSDWLLTPVSPGGKKPIDYLAEREYSIFRGFLLRVRTGQEVFQPIAASKRVHIERSREEVEDALEQLRPRAWRDEDDESDVSDAD